MTIEVTSVRRCSSETNKLRYIHIHSIRDSKSHTAIKEWEINNNQIELVLFIINHSGNCTIKYGLIKKKKKKTFRYQKN